MKNLVFVIILLFGIQMPDVLFAQKPKSYMVYSVIGDVFIQKGQQKVRIKPRTQINDSEILTVAKGAALNLLDESSCALRSVATTGSMNLREFLVKQKVNPKSLSKQYFSYLVKQLFNSSGQKMAHPDCYMQSTGTSYRSDNVDSIFLSAIATKIPMDKKFKDCITSKTVFPTTDLNVTFSIKSYSTGLEVNDHVPENESCYLSVKNGTDQPLYVNVLDIGKDGSKYLLLPVDSASTCAHLLIPGQSEVDFKSEPFIFDTTSADETFVLFAVETPIDFSVLMNPINAGDKKRPPFAVGMYKKNVVIR